MDKNRYKTPNRIDKGYNDIVLHCFFGLQSNVCCKSEVSLLNILDKENCAYHVSSKRHTALAVQPGLC